MQTFKIENYEREHGHGTFAPFKHLAIDEARRIEEALRRRLKLAESVLGKDMLQFIHNRGVVVDGANAESDQFDLRGLLNELGFALSEVTYLNWHRFDDIDEMPTQELLSYFSDIWYPATDDLELIDAQMQWVIVVHHCGTVKSLKLDKC